MIKEFKKELSKLSGVDFFNPKFRDVFKKYFPDSDEDINTNEEDRLKEVIGEEAYNDLQEEENSQEVVENITEEPEEETSSNEEESLEAENEEIAEEDKPEEVKEDEDKTVEPEEEQNNSIENDSTKEEVLETKVELELVKAGVREDRLEPAKRLFISEVKNLGDLDKLKELIKEYPEFLKSNKADTKPFGMPITDNSDVLTAEEKRLKAIGINPRD